MSRSGALRVGVVGCGEVVRDVHLPAAARAAGVEIVALADTDAGRLATLGERVGVGRRFGSHAELLDDGCADAVLVALPPREHAPVGVDVLRAGRPLLLEKPVAVDAAGARRLVEAAEEADVTAATAFNLRSHPYVPPAHRLLADGLLGPVREVRSVFTTAARPEGSWRTRADEGGHVLLDLGVHHLDLVGQLAGGPLEGLTARPDDVSGSPSSGDGGTAVVVEGRVRGGARFTGRYARSGAEVNTLETACAHGSLRLAFYELDGLRVTLAPDAPAGAADRLRLRLARLARLARHAPSLRRGGPFRDSYVRQWEDFAGAVREGRPPACTIADGARALRTALAAREAADAA